MKAPSLARLGISLVILLGLVLLVASADDSRLLIQESWSGLVFLVVVPLLVLQNLAQFLILPTLTTGLSRTLGWHEAIKLGTHSSFLSSVLPFHPGVAYKAGYLKLLGGFSLAEITSVLLVQKFLRLGICLAGLLLLMPAVGAFGYRPTGAIFRAEPHQWLILVVGLVLCSATVWILLRLGAVRNLLADFRLGVQQVVRSRRGLSLAIGLNLLVIGCNATIFAWLFKNSGFVVGWIPLTAYVCLKYLANLVNLLPGNIGISEVLTGGLAGGVGAPLELGVALALQIRFLNVGLLGLGSLAYMWRGETTSPRASH